MRCRLFSFAMLAAAHANAAVFLVGSGAGCQFPTIQPAIDAAAANPGPDVVRIANASVWPLTSLSITGHEVVLDGRFANCTDTNPGGNYAQLVGSNTANRPSVITISGGGERRLRGIQIRDNARGVGEGGAISFNGSGELILGEVEIRNNFAPIGGAISVRGSGALTLTEETLIESNVANDGGAIALRDSALLYAFTPQIRIANNTATDKGGGVYLSDLSRAFIASNGYNGLAVIDGNVAADGGGIAADANGNDERVEVTLYTTDPNRPSRLTANRASNRGGALFLSAANSLTSSGFALACFRSSHIDRNRAADGSAIFLGNNSRVVYTGSQVGSGQACFVPSVAAPPVPCVRNTGGCSLIEANLSVNASNQPTNGATVRMDGGGSIFSALNVQEATFAQNSGGNVIRVNEAWRLGLISSLLAVNTTTGALIRIDTNSDNPLLRILHTTITNNVIGGSQTIQFDDGPEFLQMNYNLVFQPGKTAVTIPFAIANSDNYNWDLNYTNPPSVLPAPFNPTTTDPRFENPAVNDYRLRIGSTLNDTFFPLQPVVGLDLDGRTRPVRLPIRQNRFNTIDVGAFERQVADNWLPNGSFGANLRYWEPDANGAIAAGVVWNSDDANGDPNSGSALVDLPGVTLPALTTLRRCFNVPGPGVYTIQAKSKRPFVATSDFGVLRWALRTTIGVPADCNSGAIAASGSVSFQGGVGNVWRPLAAPLEISIPNNVWNFSNTIDIRLDVDQGINSADGLRGVRFDDVTITGIPDLIFFNGFE
jgi:hypothetical protein